MGHIDGIDDLIGAARSIAGDVDLEHAGGDRIDEFVAGR